MQWGLFGSAVHHLGTERNHREFLPGIIAFDVPGCFAMTETGHGSDVQNIATSATYDPETQEFVVHTPFRGAWKDYIGNAALHGKAAVVFAKLVTQGVDHGVHAFYVPLRDDTGAFLPGVGGEDDGVKGGLNGIDNGRLWFDHVRVPRTNLLNRYGDVAEDGTYSSPIDSPGRRFFTMLGTLVQGRVSLDGAAVVAQKIGLQIALTYAMERRQFPTGDGHEGVLLDYGRHQRRLIPRLATVFAQSFAHEKLLQTFDDVFSGRQDTPERREDLETQAAAFKAMSTWSALDTLQECREATGGAGFLAENRITGLRADLDVYVTFEGDNTVLLQLVGKRLLTDFRKAAPRDAASTAKFVAAQVGSKLADATGLRRLGQTVADRGSLAASVADLQDPATQRSLLVGRVETMVTEIGMRLRTAGKDRARAAVLLNRSQHEPHRGVEGTCRADAVGGVHRGDRRRAAGRHPHGARLAPRPVRARAHRGAPRLAPAARADLGAARACRLGVRRPPRRTAPSGGPAARRVLRLRTRPRPLAHRERCGAGPAGRGPRLVRGRARRRTAARAGEEAAPVGTAQRPRPSSGHRVPSP